MNTSSNKTSREPENGTEYLCKYSIWDVISSAVLSLYKICLYMFFQSSFLNDTCPLEDGAQRDGSRNGKKREPKREAQTWLTSAPLHI